VPTPTARFYVVPRNEPTSPASSLGGAVAEKVVSVARVAGGSDGAAGGAGSSEAALRRAGVDLRLGWSSVAADGRAATANREPRSNKEPKKPEAKKKKAAQASRPIAAEVKPKGAEGKK
jgi:hypothetical protein